MRANNNMKQQMTSWVVLLGLLLSSALFQGSVSAAATSDAADSTNSIPDGSSPIKTPATTEATSSDPNDEVTDATKSCPFPECQCKGTKLFCENKQMTSIPTFDLKKHSFTHISLRNNSLQTFNFNQIPSLTLESLDLSLNKISSLTPPAKRAPDFGRLTALNISYNQLETLTNFRQWKFPNLTGLNLNFNPLNQTEGTDFANCKKLSTLQLSGTQIRSVDEKTFAPLSSLRKIYWSGLTLPDYSHLDDKLFANNTELTFLDLTNCSLFEVPTAVKILGNLKMLVLNGNLMTSLRPTDFINKPQLKVLSAKFCPNLRQIDEGTFGELYNLEEIVITNNPLLSYVSNGIFNNLRILDGQQTEDVKVGVSVDIFDLSGNNLTTLTDPNSMGRALGQVNLKRNPWHCDCKLKWALNLTGRSSMHCRTPEVYKDMEVSQYLKTVDCELMESSSQKFVLALSLLFLVVVLIIALAHRADLCRRFQWRDQYGTIYYTKAQFPPETTTA